MPVVAPTVIGGRTLHGAERAEALEERPLELERGVHGAHELLARHGVLPKRCSASSTAAWTTGTAAASTVPANYDALIDGQGGLDMTVLGIGGNGHIAFNEPGTQFLSWTHCTWLEDSTRKDNQASFGAVHPPQKAVTMGVKTILSSRRIVLMASGEKKKAIVEAAFRGPVSRQVPASYLQEHEGLEVLTDFGFSLTR